MMIKKNVLKKSLKKVGVHYNTCNKTKIANDNKKYFVLRGGKFVDSGGFGCVISPALPCSNKDKILNKHVSKILRNSTEDIINELKISSILKKIDPSKKYFLTYDKFCYINTIPPSRKDIINVHYLNEQLTKFDIISDQSNKDSKACDIELSLKPLNIIMEYGGYSLSNIMKTNLSDKGTKQIMHKTFIDNFKIYFRHLILGLIKMHNNRIVNRDVKPKNIMLYLNKKIKTITLKYIDFGLSNFLSLDFCKDYDNINRNGTQIYIAPDIHIIHIYNKYKDRSETFLNKKINQEITNFVKKAFNKINQKKLLGNLDTNIKNLYIKIKSLFNDNKILLYYFGNEKHKFNGYLQKNDVYALAYSMFEALHIYSNINIELDINLYDLLCNMLAFDPDKRFNAVQCINHIYFK